MLKLRKSASADTLGILSKKKKDRQEGQKIFRVRGSVELQGLISVKSDKLEGFSGKMVKIFGGFRQRIAWLLDQT